MQLVINLACINAAQQNLLLVRKRDTWILPGGKLNPEESHPACLTREFKEELPGTTFMQGLALGIFEGTSPHSQQPTKAIVYIGTLSGELTPSSEISEAKFFSLKEMQNLQVSEITRKVITALARERFLE